MPKRWTVLFSLVLISFIILAMGGALTATDKDAKQSTEVPDEVIIENQGYKSDKKGPVAFSHKKHGEVYEVACTECHHEYKEGENVWKEGDPVKKCADCHSPLQTEGDVLKLNVAYHNNCKSCHKEAVAEGKEAPYKKCTECHQKKSE